MENKKLGFNDTERFYAVHNDNNTADEIVPPGGFYPYFTVVSIGELFSCITTILNDTRYYAIQNHLESYSLHYLGYFCPADGFIKESGEAVKLSKILEDAMSWGTGCQFGRSLKNATQA